MNAKYVQKGDTIDYTPTGSALVAGDVVALTNRCGVARDAIAQNAEGALTVTGVHAVHKATTSGSGIAQDAKVYWDGTHASTSNGSGSTPLGICTKAAAEADAFVEVDIGVRA